MKISTIAIAAATLLTTIPAIAAADDPLKVIYKVSGVIDSGSASFTGIATVFFCTNFSNVPEVVRISLRAEANGAPTNNTYGFSVGRREHRHPQNQRLQRGRRTRSRCAFHPSLGDTLRHDDKRALQRHADRCSGRACHRHTAAYGPLPAGDQFAGIRADTFVA